MGLGKDKGSSRINRYEHQVTAIGFDSLEKLADVLDVPVAYLMAPNASMADAILALSRIEESKLDMLADLIPALVDNPRLLQQLAKLLQLPKREQSKALKALAGSE